MRICQHCGAPKRPDDRVLECWYGERYLLHRGCQDDWRKLMDNLPANSKVLGKAPAGHRCHHCGKGRAMSCATTTASNLRMSISRMSGENTRISQQL
jgi:hypothetical protein